MPEIQYNPEKHATIVDQTVDRSLQGKRAAASDEVRRLVEASFSLIRRTGELEPRVSEIVSEAGLHNQAFYRHFRSKHELLVAVLDQGIALLAGYLEHQMAAVTSPRDRVTAWLEGVLAQAMDPGAADATRPFALARGRLAEVCPEEVRESERRLKAPLREAIRAGVASGEFPAADPERDAEMLHLLAMGWVERRLADPTPAHGEDSAALAAFALAGLSRRASASAGDEI